MTLCLLPDRFPILIEPHNPDVFRLERINGLRQIRARDQHVLARAR